MGNNFQNKQTLNLSNVKKQKRIVIPYSDKEIKIIEEGEIEQEQGGIKTNKISFVYTSKENYISNVEKLQEHIQRGDIYEINYCIEFVAEDSNINPHATFKKLNSISEAPYACLAKFGSTYVICASPERFLQKRGNRLITQPMKGTAKRGLTLKEDKK